jgi:hypothetical protein
MMEAVKVLLVMTVGQWIVLLIILFGFGFAPAVGRRLAGKKASYWPDSEDGLIGMGLAFAALIAWGLLRG